MAEPTNIVPPRQTKGGEIYRPVSGLAIVGLIVAVLFLGLMVLSIVAAFVQGGPLFLSYAFMLMPLGGALLSFLGRRQILASEGTRAGLALTGWGLWLSALSGLGYFAYVFFTGLALTQQANAFLMEKDKDAGFFPLVLAGELNQAFLLTRPPYHRSGNPNNEDQMRELYDQPGGGMEVGGGDLTTFRDHWLIRAMIQGGKTNTHIEPLGVQSWKYEQKGYQVLRNYRIRTEELVAEVVFPVQSTEAAEVGQPRQWHVAVPQMQLKKVVPTELGKAMYNLRQSARDFTEKWILQLNEGRVYEGFKDISNWKRLVQKEELRQPFREEVIKAFATSTPGRLSYMRPEEGPVPYLASWQKVDGRLQLAHEFKLSFPNAKRQFAIDCLLTLQSKQPLDPVQLTAPPAWEIKQLEVIRVMVRPEMKGAK